MWTRIYTKHAQITSSSPYSPPINPHAVSWNIPKHLKNIMVSCYSIFHASCYCDGIFSRRVRILASLLDTMLHKHVDKDLYARSPREENRRAKNQEGGCAQSPVVAWLFDL